MIAAALHGGADAFAEEAAAFGYAYAQQILSDFNVFQDLFAELGPSLRDADP
ncbi:MAG: hypothetical protein R3F60_19320 [bacterium]